MKNLPDRLITGSEKRIYLRDVRGLGTDRFALPDGVDQDGKVWLYRHQNGIRNCAICNEPLTEGWSCFDDGKVVCAGHVTITGKIP
jgi:hypothetical protein